MNNFVFKLDKSGVRDLLKSQEMLNGLESASAGIKASCGEGYEERSFIGFDRAHCVIYPDTENAIMDNYNNNTLLKARGGGI